MPKIVFGTDGWRARIAEEYTYDAVRVCANGVAEWVKSTGEQSLADTLDHWRSIVARPAVATR